MNLFVQTTPNDLDKEWVILIQTAQKMGISIDEIRRFLKQSNTGETMLHPVITNSSYT